MKKIFYFFTAFVLIFTLVAWQYASTELADLQENQDTPSDLKITDRN